MADPFLGEIRPFAFNIVPQGWAACNGQTLQISQNNALYALLGITFGGDGKTTFCLPDLRGRTIVDAGNGTNLTPRTQGQQIGTETVAITSTQMPIHIHTISTNGKGTLKCKNTVANATVPTNNSLSANASGDQIPIYSTVPPDTPMNTNSIVVSGITEGAGAGAGHDNMQPFLTINYCIALTGIFPPRS